MRFVATFLTSAVALALGLFGAVSVQAQATPQEQFTNAINAINAQLGPFDAIKAPPPFTDPENRARYEAARAAMAQFGTDAFPVNGMISFDQVCAPINAAAVKHMFVGISAQKKPDMTQEQFAAIFTSAAQKNAMTYQQEIIRLTAINLDCMSAHIPFMAQFVDGLAPDAFTGTRRDGLEKVGTGFANTIFGLVTQSLLPGAAADVSRMAMDAALKHAPDLIPLTVPAVRQSVVARMAMLEGSVSPALRPDFLKVKAILQDQSCSGLCTKLLQTAPPAGTPPLAPPR